MSAPPRLVLDTNTVMALWFFRDPGLIRLHAALAALHYTLCCRDDAIEELRRVLAYRQFAIAGDEQARLLDTYRGRINLMLQIGDQAGEKPDDASQPLPLCRDRDDQKFLEISLDGAADYLLTRDKALLRLARHRLVRDRFRILTPERFVADLPA